MIAQAVSPKRRTQETCTCRAYAFPHRAKSGQCHAKHHGPFCGECGEPCRAKREDFGIGHYEAWGRTGIHRDVHTVSDCCEADVYDDASLTKPYQPDHD